VRSLVRTRALWTIASVAVLLALSAGCGDDGGGGDSDSAVPTTATEDDGEDGGDDGSGLEFSCPLTDEQVSEILGADVERNNEETCFYSPGGVSGIPSAGFLGQPFCDDEFPEVLGYTESLDGLGVDAYLRTDGAATAEILVCADAAFVVFVDTGTLSEDPAAVAAAEELARAALDAA
jgi:hypothetical protein